MTKSEFTSIESNIQIIVNLGCVTVTTKRQAENGTIAFKHAKTNSVYTIHTKSGYVRKHINSFYGIKMYQLNPTKKHIKESGRVCTQRILFPQDIDKLFAILSRYLYKKNKMKII